MEIIVTHANTDFDALASLVATSRLYPSAYPLAPHKPNRNVREFLALYGDEIRLFEPDDLPRQPVTCMILVDTQHIPRLEGLGLRPADSVSLIVYDHHPKSSELPAEAEFHTGETGATSTLMVELLLSSEMSISQVEATLYLAGIYEDTGHLTFADTTARDLRAAAWLLEQGANLQMVQRLLTHVITFHQRQIFEELLRTAETFHCHDHTIVLATASAPGTTEELSVVANHLMALLEPDALFLLIKLDGHVQLIARSTTEEVNVGAILSELGGGGHPRAAAALVKVADLDALKADLKAALQRRVAPALSVEQVMVRRVIELRADATAADAHREMLRLGIPLAVVVDGQGVVTGAVSRRDVDRALHHGLPNLMLKTFMRRRPPMVNATDPVSKARTLMVETDMAALPVVEEGRLVGTILATDILRTWPGAPQPGATAVDLSQELEQALSEGLMDILRLIGVKASEMGYRAYLVGGIVRDVVLHIRNFDVDVVVEGDAIKLGKAIASALGLEIVTHPRFGTAKLDTARLEGVPREAGTIDLATARTEFYARPGALPTVQPSSLRLDLLRRDFTVNTLAVSLNPSSFGRLIDHFGGLRDLEKKLLRVLHNFSFVEDPTRMLRAARLEARLGFRVEERTEELIHQAVELGLLETVSRERIYNELDLIMKEEKPEKALSKLSKWGVLGQIHPGLVFDDRSVRWFEQARAELSTVPAGSSQQLVATYFCLLALSIPVEEHGALVANLGLRKSTRAAVLAIDDALDKLEKLGPEPDPGDLVVALRSVPEPTLWAIRIARASTEVAGAVAAYLDHLRHVRPELGGDFLRSLGLPPGPAYRRILTELLKEKARGRLPTTSDEVEWMRAQVEELRSRA